jgi:hypothetical protein
MADNLEVNDLFKRLRAIVESYSGPGVAFEETEIDVKRNSDFWQTVAQLEHLGVSQSSATPPGFRLSASRHDASARDSGSDNPS